MKMDSAGAQVLSERLAAEHPDRIERERADDRFALRCSNAYEELLAIQRRNRESQDEA